MQSGDEVRRGLRAAGLSERAAAGVVDMTAGPNAGCPSELPRTALSTTPSTLAGWAFTDLRPALSADHGRMTAPATHPPVGGGSG